MQRKMSKSGNGWAVFIPKAIIELLGITPEEDFVEFEIENKTLKIKKAENDK